ncbi:unnamed protein product, partial [Ectocarpus sp. 12 AP-2014]
GFARTYVWTTQMKKYGTLSGRVTTLHPAETTIHLPTHRRKSWRHFKYEIFSNRALTYAGPVCRRSKSRKCTPKPLCVVCKRLGIPSKHRIVLGYSLSEKSIPAGDGLFRKGCVESHLCGRCLLPAKRSNGWEHPRDDKGEE